MEALIRTLKPTQELKGAFKGTFRTPKEKP